MSWKERPHSEDPRNDRLSRFDLLLTKDVCYTIMQDVLRRKEVILLGGRNNNETFVLIRDLAKQLKANDVEFGLALDMPIVKGWDLKDFERTAKEIRYISNEERARNKQDLTQRHINMTNGIVETQQNSWSGVIALVAIGAAKRPVVQPGTIPQFLTIPHTSILVIDAAENAENLKEKTKFEKGSFDYRVKAVK